MPSHPTPVRFHRLLLTGAAGGLGRELRTRLKAYCTTLRLSDIANLGGEGAGEELRPARLEDAGAAVGLLRRYGFGDGMRKIRIINRIE